MMHTRLSAKIKQNIDQMIASMFAPFLSVLNFYSDAETRENENDIIGVFNDAEINQSFENDEAILMR